MAASSFIRAVAGLTDATGARDFGSSFGAPNLPINTIVLIQILQDGSTRSSCGYDFRNFNWAALDGTTSSAIGSFPVGGSSEAIQHLWITRAVAANQGITFSGTNSTSEDLYFRAYAFSDVSTGTTLATVIENIGGTDDLYANEQAPAPPSPTPG